MSLDLDERLRRDLRTIADSIDSEPPPRQQLADRRRRHRLGMGVVVGVVAVGGGAGLAVSLTQDTPAGTSTTPDGTPAPSIEPSFPTNASGQTYGNPDPRVGLDDYPDLLHVEATNGKTGYVDRHLLDELTGANLSSPDEAVEWQRQQDAAGPGVTYIPVYESDGTTVIGEFPISRSSTTQP
jgi:hypothetical protein